MRSDLTHRWNGIRSGHNVAFRNAPSRLDGMPVSKSRKMTICRDPREGRGLQSCRRVLLLPLLKEITDLRSDGSHSSRRPLEVTAVNAPLIISQRVRPGQTERLVSSESEVVTQIERIFFHQSRGRLQFQILTLQRRDHRRKVFSRHDDGILGPQRTGRENPDSGMNFLRSAHFRAARTCRRSRLTVAGATPDFKRDFTKSSRHPKSTSETCLTLANLPKTSRDVR